MEVEIKFDIPDQETFERLLAAESLVDMAAGPMKVKAVHDRYLDTADYAFLRGGFACRIRHSAGRQTVTIKGLGGSQEELHSRAELEVELPPDGDEQVASWPHSEAKAQAQALAGDLPLRLLFEVWQTRHQRFLRAKADGIDHIELSLDQVHLGKIDGPPFFELEAELLPGGTLEALQGLAADLKARWKLTPQPTSKFERCLALSDPALLERFRAHALSQDGPGVRPDDHMAEACRKILRFQFEIMLANEAGSRLGKDIEFVHDMRVATRRMRAAIRLLGDYFEPKPLKRFAKDLRNTGRALGAVRDLDVFEHKARDEYLAKLPPDRQQSLDPLLDHWHQQRELARTQLNAYLDSPKYRKFVDRFSQFVVRPGMAVPPIAPGDPVRHQVRHVLGSLLWRLYETVRAYEVVLDDPPPETLHALRIDCKRLRYALEFFGEVLGPEARSVIQQVKQVQDHLGDLQDAIVAVDLLTAWEERLAAAPAATAEAISGVVAYQAHRAIEAHQLVTSFPDAWPQIAGRGFREELAAAILAL